MGSGTEQSAPQAASRLQPGGSLTMVLLAVPVVAKPALVP